MGTSSSSRELGLERTLYDGFSLDSLAVFHDPGESATKSWHDKRKTVVEYLWADGTLLSSTDYYKKESGRYRPVAGRGDRAYYQTDALGTVRAALDSRANVLEAWRYDAFGTAYSGSFGDEYRFGYTGKAYDSVTGAYDYGFRDYAPTLGRFTTVDPIRDGTNWYAYCGSDPVNYVDLWGLKPVKSSPLRGMAAHGILGDIVNEQLGGQIEAIYLDSPLNGIPFLESQLLKRPDIVIVKDDGSIEIYELKPETYSSGYNNALAQVQLAMYISNIPGSVGGTSLELPDTNLFPTLGNGATVTYRYDPVTPGLVYYSLDDGTPCEKAGE